jgi:hypothetical protein
MSCGVSVPARFEQEPGAPLGFIDPDLDQAGRGNVTVLVANVVCLAQARRHRLVVFAQFRQHVGGLDALSVIVQHALEADDVAVDLSVVPPNLLTRSAIGSVIA